MFKANKRDGGAGEALGETYEARGLPHFILMNASGEAIDRWVGFRDAPDWLRTFGQARSDLATIEAKEQRFKTAPTEPLAASLGRIYGSLRASKESVEAYRDAERLAGGPKPDYAVAIFFETVQGSTTGTFTVEDVRAAADSAMGMQGVEPVDQLLVAGSMADFATDKNDPSLFAPYLAPALKASEGLTDERAKDQRAELEISGALLVKGDKDLALSLKRKSMPSGWESDSGELNEFAWWCYENKLNLEEAEKLARKGAALAPPGAERAAVLDTAAEICNLLGSCDDAVLLAEQAVKEDPKSEHYAKQLKRFAEIRDKKQSEAGA